jgi:phosphatidylglycerophosphatase A
MKKCWKILASFFGLGYIPIAPGTAASLVVALAYKLVLSSLAWPYLLLVFLLILFFGVVASTSYARELGRSDPGVIVIDEACGQLLVLFFVPPAWASVLIAFLLFRFFDIVKPYPISKAEKLAAGWGIMADDLAAAAAAKVLLHLYLWLK